MVREDRRVRSNIDFVQGIKGYELNGTWWADWSQVQLEQAAERGGLLINPVTYAEFSVWYDNLEAVDQMLAAFGAAMEELPREAQFLADKAFRRYRARRGTRPGVRPDFLSGRMPRYARFRC